MSPTKKEAKTRIKECEEQLIVIEHLRRYKRLTDVNAHRLTSYYKEEIEKAKKALR